MSTEYATTDEVLELDDASTGIALDDSITNVKTRRMLARRKLEEKEEMRRLRYQINDPLFEF